MSSQPWVRSWKPSPPHPSVLRKQQPPTPYRFAILTTSNREELTLHITDTLPPAPGGRGWKFLESAHSRIFGCIRGRESLRTNCTEMQGDTLNSAQPCTDAAAQAQPREFHRSGECGRRGKAALADPTSGRVPGSPPSSILRLRATFLRKATHVSHLRSQTLRIPSGGSGAPEPREEPRLRVIPHR